jgi:hypothetical protein
VARQFETVTITINMASDLDSIPYRVGKFIKRGMEGRHLAGTVWSIIANSINITSSVYVFTGQADLLVIFYTYIWKVSYSNLDQLYCVYIFVVLFSMYVGFRSQ